MIAIYLYIFIYILYLGPRYYVLSAQHVHNTYLYSYIAPIAFGGHFALGGYLLSTSVVILCFFPIIIFVPRTEFFIIKDRTNDRFGDLCDGCGIERKKWRSGRHAEAVKNYSGCARIRAV